MGKLKPTLTALAFAAFTVLALALSAVPALANGIAVSIDAPDEVAEGSTFTVDIDIDYVEELAYVQFDLAYDNTVIGFKAAILGDFWGAVAEDVEVETNEFADRVRVLLDYKECNPLPGGGVTGSGTLVELEFDVLGTAGETSVLEMSPYAPPPSPPCPNDFCNGMWDHMARDLSCTWADGSVHVTSTAISKPTPTPNGTPSPTDTPAPTATPTPNGTPSPTDTPTPPDATGGLLWWHYLLIGLGALVVLAFIVMLFTRRTIS